MTYFSCPLLPRVAFVCYNTKACGHFSIMHISLSQLGTSCLPHRGHPRVASLAPSGQFTFRGTASAVEGVSRKRTPYFYLGTLPQSAVAASPLREGAKYRTSLITEPICLPFRIRFRTASPPASSGPPSPGRRGFAAPPPPGRPGTSPPRWPDCFQKSSCLRPGSAAPADTAAAPRRC